MERESKNKSVHIWIEEILEEIEIQFYGITGAILFFIVIYFIFQPIMMRTVFHLFKIELPAGNSQVLDNLFLINFYTQLLVL